MQYFTRGGDRLFNLCQEFYGEITDEGMASIVYANATVWDGKSHLEPGIMLDIPETPTEFDYNTRDSYADVDTMRRQADVGAPQAPLDPTVATFMDDLTGDPTDVAGAIRQAVRSRVLCYRRTRAMKPDYGTRFIRILGANDTPAQRDEGRQVIAAALAPDSDFYVLDGIDVAVREDSTIAWQVNVLSQVAQEAVPIPESRRVVVSLS